MYREKIDNANKKRLLGSVAVKQPRMFSIAAYVVFASFILLFFVMQFGSISIKSKLPGFVSSDKASVKIYGDGRGVVDHQFIYEGDTVAGGDPVLKLRMGNLSLSANSDKVKAELITARSIVEKNADISQRALEGKILNLKEELESRTNELSIIREKIELQERIINRFSNSEKRAKKELSKGLITRSDVDEIELAVLDRQQDLSDLKIQYEATKRQIMQAKQNREQYQLDIASKHLDFHNQLVDINERILKVSPDSVRTVIAPIAGRVSAVQANLGQQPKQEIPLLTIVPSDVSYTVTLLATSQVIGRLARDMEVRIKYQAYPSQRFGTYLGKIIKISENALSANETIYPLSHDDPVYLVVVALEQQVVTAHNKLYYLKAGMAVNAEVIIEKTTPIKWLTRSLAN